MTDKVLTVLVSLVGALAGCTSSTSTLPMTSQDGGSEASAGDAGIVGCTPRAGLGPTGFYPPEALPSGACTSDDRTCRIGIQQWCPCGTKGPVDEYQCTCANGSWSCAVFLNGGTGCDCPKDAGLDAADAANDSGT